MPIPNRLLEPQIQPEQPGQPQRNQEGATILPFPRRFARPVDASLSRRFLAHGFDFLLVCGLSLFIGDLFAMFMAMSLSSGYSAAGSAAETLFYYTWDYAFLRMWAATYFPLAAVYHVGLLAWKGRTFGKALCGLRVLQRDGSALRWKGAALRFLAYHLSYCTIGLALPLHNRVSDSYIVREIGDG